MTTRTQESENKRKGSKQATRNGTGSMRAGVGMGIKQANRKHASRSGNENQTSEQEASKGAGMEQEACEQEASERTGVGMGIKQANRKHASEQE